jgi:ABC-2 type transport system ATP-binding protein
MSTTPVIAVDHLVLTYRVGFLRKRVHAVRGISFEVNEGEIVGLVGPNGSGKTSTIKTLMGLCAPTAGDVRLFGRPSSDRRSREQVGFLPENPYVYPYLTAREFVDLCARLSGIGEGRERRVREVLDRTGIAYAADRPVRSYSKGMLQRTGLAAALVADPRLLVLDEPMSGLDPLGRREVRDLIHEERRGGRTVLFSSHVLSDVEALCDRVVILRKGEVVVRGAIDELVRRDAKLAELTLRGVSESARPTLVGEAKVLRTIDDVVAIEVEGEAALQAALRRALEAGAKVVSVTPRKDSLEDLFLREAVAPRTSEAKASD